MENILVASRRLGRITERREVRLLWFYKSNMRDPCCDENVLNIDSIINTLAVTLHVNFARC